MQGQNCQLNPKKQLHNSIAIWHNSCRMNQHSGRLSRGAEKSNQILSAVDRQILARFSFYGLALVASLIRMPKPKLTLRQALHANENGRHSTQKVMKKEVHSSCRRRCKFNPRQLISARRSTINQPRTDGRTEKADAKQRNAKQSKATVSHRTCSCR